MKNRLFSIFLSIILCIGLLPTTALADTTMIYIGGVMLQSGNYLASGGDAQTDEKPSGGYAYLECENGDATLTLNNFVYTGDSGYEDAMIDTAEGMLIINLIGKNALTDTGYTDNIDTGFKYGILNEMSGGVTRVTGDGSLDIKSYYDGISASNVELQSGTINIESYENCIDAGSDVEISGGSLTITSEGRNGIVAGDTVKIDQALVTIDADDDGIYAKDEYNDIAVSLSNATVNIKATDKGVYTDEDDGCVSVTGCILTYDGYDRAIYTEEKKAHISISDSILKLKTQSDDDPILDVKNSKSDIDIKNSILLFESQYGFDEEDDDDVYIESALINHNGDITIYAEDQYTLPEELILEIDPNKDMSVVEGEDTLTVTGQSLTLNGGNIQMEGKIINNSTITVDEGAIVTVTGEVANNGKINNNGTINIETIDLLKGTGEIEGDGLFQITSFFPSEIEIDGNWVYNGTDQAVAVKDAVKVPATITLQGQEFTYPQIDASKIKIEPAVVKDAGDYTVSFTNGGGFKEFSMAPAEIVIDTVIVAEKTYNGEKDAEISSVMFKTVDGTNIFDTVEKGTDYTAEGVFDSENVGENIPVSVTVEWKNPNYTLQGTTAESTGTIVPKSLTPVIIVKENVIYGVNSLSPDIQVMDGEDEIDAKEYTVSYSNNEKVGTATVSVTDVNGGNYVLGSVSQYYTINKADIDLSIDFSPVAQKANKDVTVIVTAKNKDTDKDADGWMQPTEVSLTAPESMREKTPFTQTDSTKGIWEAVYTVNNDAPLGKVDFTTAVSDTT
ncbi:MAG: carbohydrate-binding domain-containing protein, partial [Anaerotignum sp.]|nr:carbohydrate-binding domain-containing protein [Anaerotignum sp.]